LVVDGGYRWDWYDFLQHYYFGGGGGVTLSEIGHLRDVVSYVETRKYAEFSSDIIYFAQRVGAGKFTVYKDWSIDFSHVHFVHGRGLVTARFSGEVLQSDGYLSVDGRAEYTFEDTFTDDANIRQRLEKVGVRLSDLPHWFVGLSDFGGTKYEIADRWLTRFKGLVRDERVDRQDV